MLWLASDLKGYRLRATDGAIGSIDDLLFDDIDWTLRWVVVDTGNWLPGRRVLLPPSSLKDPDRVSREFPVDLTQEQIKNSPDIDTDSPVSRQMETDVYGYYGWTPYWGTGFGGFGYAAGVAAPPNSIAPRGAGWPAAQGPGEPRGDPDLRSVREVTGYYIHAKDGDIGHVEDFLIDEESAAVRYLVVDTRNWWPGKKVLVSPQWFRDVSWSQQKVFVDLTRDQVKESPEFDPGIAVDRGYEERLYSHYGYTPYWSAGWV